MGKFINTQYKDTVDSLANSSKDFLNNPFYRFSDKKPTRTKYWNINKEKSTMDQGSQLQQVEVGADSPMRFNLIEDLFVFGIPRVEMNLEYGEFGLEAEPITGECYIMPNIIEPYPGDFFQVDYMFDKPWLFMVTEVNRDTFYTGSTVWKLSYRLERHEDQSIKKNVVDEFIAIDKQEGTNFKTVVQKKRYYSAVELDELAAMYKKYYVELFFDQYVQTFIYKWLNWSNMYDPFMIEFMIRNGILENNSDNYIHVEHMMPVPNTFSIDYNATIYRAIECRDKKMLASCVYLSQADVIRCMASIFNSRFDDYFALTYKPSNLEPGAMNARDNIEVFPQDLIYAIEDNSKEIFDLKKPYLNIFIKYFNDDVLSREDIDAIKCIQFNDSKEMYYMIPFVIFILEYYTKKLLS